MADLKRTWPMARRAVKGFFFGAEALGLSLEATGLAAYIYSWDGDEIDDEILKAMFPDRDLSGPLAELASVGIIDLSGAPAPPRAPTLQDMIHRPGTIYLIEGGGRYKIGISQGSAEQLAHGLLMRFRLHGEWFECTEEQAREALRTVIEAVGAAK